MADWGGVPCRMGHLVWLLSLPVRFADFYNTWEPDARLSRGFPTTRSLASSNTCLQLHLHSDPPA